MRHRNALTAAIVAVGLLLTALAGVRVSDTQRTAVEQRLLVDATAYAGELEGELERHLGAAYAIREVFHHAPIVGRSEYERAIEAIGEESLTGLQGINVIRPVAGEDVADFVRNKRETGYEDFAVEEPSSPRDRWLVSLVAPFEGNGHLLGIDVRDVPGLAEPFARARDRRSPVMGPVVAEPAGRPPEPRVGLAVPVYREDALLATVEERRANLVGWVVTTVRTEELVDRLQPTDVEVLVVDGTGPARTTVGRSGVADGDHARAAERRVEILGRTWTVRVAPGPRYLAGVERWAMPVVVVLGLLLTAAIAALVHVLGQRSAHARRLVEVRTRELADSNAELTAVNDELGRRLAELRDHGETDHLVQRATAEVSQARSVADALERLRAVLGEVAAFDRIGFSERLQGRRMEVREWVGEGIPAVTAGVEFVASSWMWDTFAGQRRLVLIDDTAAAPEGSLERVLARRGIGGLVSVPLVTRGEVAGLLTLVTGPTLDLSAGAVDRLSRVVDGIAGPLVTLLGLEAERRASEQLRRLDELKDEFVGVVAHDLRAPLAVVTGYTDLLLVDCDAGVMDPTLTREALTAVQRAAGSQERLIADLLESQRLALGVAVPLRAEIALADLVRGTVRDLAIGNETQVAFADDTDGAAVSVDPEWIQRVVTNLVTNAWRYGSDEIEVRVARDVDTVRVTVTDHGQGIAASDVPRLFQRFSRLAGAARDGGRRTVGGTGLGLYICRKLVEAHGGRVGVDTEPGRGATFWFELPAVVVPARVQA